MSDADGAPVTLINVFSCTPERQDQVVQLVQGMTDEVMRRLPGFVSARLYRILDG